MRHVGAYLPKPPLVAQRLGERFGLAEIGKALSKFSECLERITQVVAEIDGLFLRTLLGKMPQGGQRLFETRHCLPIGRACHGFVSSLPVVGERFIPHLALQGVVRQSVDLFRQAVGIEGLHDLDDPRMQHPPPLLGQTAVRHLVGQRVLEGVGVLREEVGLVEKLSRLEVPEAFVHGRLGQLGDRLQQRHGHLGTNNRGRVQQALLGSWQAVDARRQHCLHRAVSAWVAGPASGDRPRAAEHPGLHQGAHALLQEEGIALRARNEALDERLEGRVLPEEFVQQFRGTRGGGVEAELSVVRLAAPAMVIVGTVVDEEQAGWGRLSTRRSRNACVAVSIQCRFSTTTSSGCTWLARSSRRVQASRVRWRRCRLECLPVRVFNWYV